MQGIAALRSSCPRHAVNTSLSVSDTFTRVHSLVANSISTSHPSYALRYGLTRVNSLNSQNPGTTPVSIAA